MTSATFGYDEQEDRLWLRHQADAPRLWLTRRFVLAFFLPMIDLVERTTTRPNVPGLSADKPPHINPTLMEHRLAVEETPQGQAHYPFQTTQESREEVEAHGFVLCKAFQINMQSHSCQVIFSSDQGNVQFQLTRQETHLWLRVIRMVLDRTNWGIGPLPDWLTQPVLPPSIQNLIDNPMPPLEEDDDNEQPKP